MTQAKLCSECKKANLEKALRPQYLSFEGTPEFKVNYLVQYCPNCQSESMSIGDTQKLDELFLSQIVKYYSEKSWELPGKVANWMRKVIDLTAREISELSHTVSESALSHSFKDNKILDRTAATILLLKVQDYVHKTKKCDEFLKTADDLNLLYKPVVSVDLIVNAIAPKISTEVVRVQRKGGREKLKSVASVGRVANTNSRGYVETTPQSFRSLSSLYPVVNMKSKKNTVRSSKAKGR